MKGRVKAEESIQDLMLQLAIVFQQRIYMSYSDNWRCAAPADKAPQGRESKTTRRDEKFFKDSSNCVYVAFSSAVFVLDPSIVPH